MGKGNHPLELFVTHRIRPGTYLDGLVSFWNHVGTRAA